MNQVSYYWGGECTDKQGEKTIMIHVVMDQSQRPQGELMFKLIQIQQVIYKKYLQILYIYIYIYIYVCVYVYVCVCIYISLSICQLRGSKSNNTSLAMNILGNQILVSSSILQWASLMAQTVKNLPSMPGFNPWVRTILWRRAWQPTPVFLPGESHLQ